MLREKVRDKVTINPNHHWGTIDASGSLYYPLTIEQKPVALENIAASSQEFHIISAYFTTPDQEFTISDKIDLIKDFRKLSKGWDSYNSPPPNETSIHNAIDALKIFWQHNCLPEKITPSSDEGIAFEFVIDDEYYLFEFSNDDEIFFLKRENGKPKAIEITFPQIEDKILEMKKWQLTI